MTKADHRMVRREFLTREIYKRMNDVDLEEMERLIFHDEEGVMAKLEPNGSMCVYMSPEQVDKVYNFLEQMINKYGNS